MGKAITKLVNTMDQLYEYDREPIPPRKFQPGRYYAGLLAGEHVAGTEFVIGAFFVLHGVSVLDLLLGLLFGNLLAVLCWTFICAPIATDTRLTLYWYLRKIAGPGLTLIYNFANGVLFCILAGAMISVSATAVGISLNIPTPALNDVLPTSSAWILTTLVIGIAFTILAILGFETVSRFGGVCSPWIFVAFAAGAIATLPRLGVHPNLDNLWQVAQTKIWNGVPTPGQEKFEIWHVLFFAWFCNLAMHVGLSDMALFRYFRGPGSGGNGRRCYCRMDDRKPHSLSSWHGFSMHHPELAALEGNSSCRHDHNIPGFLPGIFSKAIRLCRYLRSGAYAGGSHCFCRALDLPPIGPGTTLG
jgi:hypothetical protein